MFVGMFSSIMREVGSVGGFLSIETSVETMRGMKKYRFFSFFLCIFLFIFAVQKTWQLHNKPIYCGQMIGTFFSLVPVMSQEKF